MMKEFKDNRNNPLKKGILYEIVRFQKKFPQPLLYKGLENKAQEEVALFEDVDGKESRYAKTELNFIYEYTPEKLKDLKRLYSWIESHIKTSPTCTEVTALDEERMANAAWDSPRNFKKLR